MVLLAGLAGRWRMGCRALSAGRSRDRSVPGPSGVAEAHAAPIRALSKPLALLYPPYRDCRAGGRGQRHHQHNRSREARSCLLRSACSARLRCFNSGSHVNVRNGSSVGGTSPTTISVTPSGERRRHEACGARFSSCCSRLRLVHFRPQRSLLVAGWRPTARRLRAAAWRTARSP
jgi:hypothetical protein